MTTDSARRPQAEDGEERARGSSHAPAARLRREGASSDCPGCKLNTSLRRRLISGHSSGLISLVLSATYDTLRWLSPSGISLLPWFQESEPSQLSHEGNTMHMDDQWSVPGQYAAVPLRGVHMKEIIGSICKDVRQKGCPQSLGARAPQSPSNTAQEDFIDGVVSHYT
ncbi:uncharacterized protein LOC108584750 isoform X4 [Papio anubis]|uniref:uncharacterized protein LOC108584750 isoform X4 n=1 Tax=Papio anubis TaxID=9555 RepID=UPI0012AD7F71|nr:uncharacterized protein LOC108584750 isoform X4 [Papio anubis]